MAKKIALTLLVSFGVLLANSTTKVKTVKKYEKGWWWYEETYKTPDGNKTIRYKVSSLDKARLEREENTNKLLKTLIIQMQENNKIQNKILKKLQYAFPDTVPKYSVNSKGEKCLTNSSADCFMMPVTAEGQQVPVLKNFLRNPSPKNSEEWLKWQAKYFNHISKISHGLRFAFLNKGSEVYNTPTDYTYGDNLFFGEAEAMKGTREAKIITSLKDKLVYLIFLGQNQAFEEITNTYKHFTAFDKTFMKDMGVAIVLPSQEAKEYLEKKVIPRFKKQNYKQVVDFFKKSKIVINPGLYKKYNVRITPTVVVFYEEGKGKNKKQLYQIISVGEISVYRIRSATMNFLKYYGIIDPGEMGADKNWANGENTVDKNITKLPKPKKAINFDKIDENIKKIEQAQEE